MKIFFHKNHKFTFEDLNYFVYMFDELRNYLLMECHYYCSIVMDMDMNFVNYNNNWDNKMMIDHMDILIENYNNNYSYQMDNNMVKNMMDKTSMNDEIVGLDKMGYLLLLLYVHNDLNNFLNHLKVFMVFLTSFFFLLWLLGLFSV